MFQAFKNLLFFKKQLSFIFEALRRKSYEKKNKINLTELFILIHPLCLLITKKQRNPTKVYMHYFYVFLISLYFPIVVHYFTF